MNQPPSILSADMQRHIALIAHGSPKYDTILTTLSAFSSFIHTVRLVHESAAMGIQAPSFQRTEALAESEMLADFDEALSTLIKHMPSASALSEAAAADFQYNEPGCFYQEAKLWLP